MTAGLLLVLVALIAIWRDGPAVAERPARASELISAVRATPPSDTAPMLGTHAASATGHILLTEGQGGVTAAVVEDEGHVCLATRDAVGSQEGCTPVSTLEGGKKVLANMVIISETQVRLTVLVPDAATDLTIATGRSASDRVPITRNTFSRVIARDALPVTLSWSDAAGQRQSMTLSV